jgi:prevent-host-death family protein
MARVVKIGELKNRLSAYLSLVRQGQEVIVLDRSKPVARIVPLHAAEDYDAEEQALVAAGQLRPGSRAPDPAFWRSFWKQPAPRVPLSRAVAAVLEDREES